MGFWTWLENNWFTVLQSVGIVGGLLSTAVLLRADAKARRITNLVALTQQHLDVWRELYERPELARILRPTPASQEHPITKSEQLFVRSLVLHLYSAFRAMREGLYIKPAGLKRDIAWFFSLPIPAEVWKQLKSFQDRDFVVFVEECRVSPG